MKKNSFTARREKGLENYECVKIYFGRWVIMFVSVFFLKNLFSEWFKESLPSIYWDFLVNLLKRFESLRWIKLLNTLLSPMCSLEEALLSIGNIRLPVVRNQLCLGCSLWLFSCSNCKACGFHSYAHQKWNERNIRNTARLFHLNTYLLDKY